MNKAKKIKKLAFRDLKLEQIVFEARFPFVWLYSDCAGSLWKEIEDKLPTGRFVVNSFDSAGGVCTYKDKFEISVARERLLVAGFYPETNLRDYLEVLKVVFENAAEKLQFDILYRIGVRLNFVKKFDSLDKATDSLLTLPHINIPTNIYSELSKEVIMPSMNVRIEDETKGRLYMIRNLVREFNLDLPLYHVAENNESTTRGFQEYIVSFDVDTYTKKNLSVGQISSTDWVNQIYHSVQKDSLNFFEFNTGK